MGFRTLKVNVKHEELNNSWFAVLTTSMEYVANDLRKKFSQFLMCIMTVFLTVSFITFLNGIGQLAPIVTLNGSVYTSGDMDMQIMGMAGRQKEKLANTNFYNDENEFFNAPFLSNEQKKQVQTTQNFMSNIPTVNFVELEKVIEKAYAGVERPVEIFPRWMAQTVLYNTERTHKTQAYLIAGDQSLERNLGIAPGFPRMQLKKDEMITTTDVMSLLNLKVGEEMNVDIDFFQLVSRDFVKFKRLVFEYDAMNTKAPQGEAILNFLGIPVDFTFNPESIISKRLMGRLKSRFLASTQLFECVNRIVNFVEDQDNVLAAEFIEVAIPCISPETFQFTKKMKVVAEVEHASGKWPEALGHGFFFDSNFIIPYLIEMVQNKIFEAYNEHRHAIEYAEATEDLASLLLGKLDAKIINKYAIIVFGKINHREDVYLKNNGYFANLQRHLNRFSFHIRNEGYFASSPQLHTIEKLENMNF